MTIRMYAEPELLRMPRARLLEVAAHYGISAMGKATSWLVDRILLEQGRHAGAAERKAPRPNKVRLDKLEAACIRLEGMVLELGACVGETEKTLRALARMHGVNMHPDIQDLALKYRAKRPLIPASVLLKRVVREV